MIWLIVQGRQLPAGYERICCKSVAAAIFVLRPVKAAKHNCLAANMLQQPVGVELNRIANHHAGKAEYDGFLTRLGDGQNHLKILLTILHPD